MKIKGLPIVVCHREEHLNLSPHLEWEAREQSVDRLLDETLEQLVTEVAKLIEVQLKNGEQVYLLIGSFVRREGIFVRLWWRNNFHWEIVGKKLTTEEMDVLRPHWADGYEYGKGCVCDKEEKIR